MYLSLVSSMSYMNHVHDRSHLFIFTDGRQWDLSKIFVFCSFPFSSIIRSIVAAHTRSSTRTRTHSHIANTLLCSHTLPGLFFAASCRGSWRHYRASPDRELDWSGQDEAAASLWRGAQFVVCCAREVCGDFCESVKHRTAIAATYIIESMIRTKNAATSP